MAHYTTEVRFICETACGLDESSGGNNVMQICKDAAPIIFDENLELFDSGYKEILLPKILLHYYTREIAFETVGLWILKLNTKMEEILPYYNQLYRSEMLKFDPLHNFNLVRSHVEQGRADSHGNSAGSNSKTNSYSDTPNGALTGVMNDQYLSSASRSTGSNASNYTTESSDGRFWQEMIKGNSGHNMSQLLLDFRKTMLNIDMDVIDDLKDLFFKLW